MRVLEVEHLVQRAVLEAAGEYLGLHLVDGGEHSVLLEVEQGGGSSEGVEALEGVGRGVEVSHYLRALYLVEDVDVVLGDDVCVGLQAGLAYSAAADQHQGAVCRVLAVALVPDYRVDVEAGDGVEVAVNHRVAAHLDVAPEDLYFAHGVRKAVARGVRQLDGCGYGIFLCRVAEAGGVHCRGGKAEAVADGKAVGDGEAVLHGRGVCRGKAVRHRRLLGAGLLRAGGIALRGSGASCGLLGAVFLGSAFAGSALRRSGAALLVTFFGSCGGSLCGLLPELLDGVCKDVVQTVFAGLEGALRNVAEACLLVRHPVCTYVDGITLAFFFRKERHCGVAGEGYLAEGVFVVDAVCNGGNLAEGVLHLPVAKEQKVSGGLVVV